VIHGVTHVILNTNPALNGMKVKEKTGCIEIQDKVFAGVGSLVNKDIPQNSVVEGLPESFFHLTTMLQRRRQREPTLSTWVWGKGNK